MNYAQERLDQQAAAWRQLRPDAPFIYEEWLLKNGEAQGPLVNRRGTGLRLGPKKMCYMNSFRAVSNRIVDPNEWFYTEGVVTIPRLPLLIDHAWLSNKKGEVLDLTLRQRKDEEVSYYGVPMNWDFVVKEVLKSTVYGVFSNGITYNMDAFEHIDEGRAWAKINEYSS